MNQDDNLYRVSIQAIDERLDNAILIQEQMGGNIYLDKEKAGILETFKLIIKNEARFGKYLVHFQDDVILADKLEDYCNTIVQDIKACNIHLLSLYVPKRKVFPAELLKNTKKKYYVLDNFLWCQGLVISPEMLKILDLYSETYKEQDKHDDVFIADCLKKFKLKAYVHIPGLVQHNITFKSSVSHSNSIQRTSELFNKDYIIRQ
jgi:hypothetical protein